MFDRESQPTMTESVVEWADSGIEAADSTADYAENPLKIGLWVWAFKVNFLSYRDRADKSTIFGMRTLSGFTINSGRGVTLKYL